MITELGKLCLCPPLLWCTASSACLDFSRCSWGLLPWHHFEHIFLLSSGWNWLCCFFGLFKAFSIYFFLKASLGLWSYDCVLVAVSIASPCSSVLRPGLFFIRSLSERLTFLFLIGSLERNQIRKKLQIKLCFKLFSLFIYLLGAGPNLWSIGFLKGSETKICVRMCSNRMGF